jgi:hypothetical protein
MAKVVDPRNLPPQPAPFPGMKPPVMKFEPTDEGVDSVEIDAFNELIRKLRQYGPVTPSNHERPASRH